MQKVLHVKAKVLAGGRIEIVDPEFPVGEAVDVTVRHPSEMPQLSAVDILEEAQGQRLFKTLADVESYLDDERASWSSRYCLTRVPYISTQAVSYAALSASSLIVYCSRLCGGRGRSDNSKLFVATSLCWRLSSSRFESTTQSSKPCFAHCLSPVK